MSAHKLVQTAVIRKRHSALEMCIRDRGYLSLYGFLLELNSVNTTLFNLSPVVESSTFTPATVLAEHRTTTGEVVFDQFNDPDSAYAIDGSNADAHTRPAGYGHDEILMDVTNQAYPHIVTADATPIMIGDGDVPESADEYTWENAAYVSVFVPVMFSISPSTGEQYACCRRRCDVRNQSTCFCSEECI